MPIPKSRKVIYFDVERSHFNQEKQCFEKVLEQNSLDYDENVVTKTEVEIIVSNLKKSLTVSEQQLHKGTKLQ